MSNSFVSHALTGHFIMYTGGWWWWKGNVLQHVKRGNCPGGGNVRGIRPGEMCGSFTLAAQHIHTNYTEEYRDCIPDFAIFSTISRSATSVMQIHRVRLQ